MSYLAQDYSQRKKQGYLYIVYNDTEKTSAGGRNIVSFGVTGQLNVRAWVFG